MFRLYSNSLHGRHLPLIVSSQLVIRVHLSDESSKTMMVDERQTVRQVRLLRPACGQTETLMPGAALA